MARPCRQESRSAVHHEEPATTDNPLYTEGMPSRIRLIAIDIDGTLLPTSSTTISNRNRRALREAQAAGIHIVIATGRRHQYAAPVLQQVGLAPHTVMISSNGSVVRHFERTLIQRNLL